MRGRPSEARDSGWGRRTGGPQDKQDPGKGNGKMESFLSRWLEKQECEYIHRKEQGGKCGRMCTKMFLYCELGLSMIKLLWLSEKS